MAEVHSSIGDRIRAARKRLGFSQDELAQRADLGHHQIVSQIEKGEREVKATELARLSRVLHVTLGELLGSQEPLATRVCWRDEPEEGGKEYEGRLLAFCRAYHHARTALGESPTRRLAASKLDLSTAEYPDIDRFAQEIATLLNLGARPASSLADTLESQFDILIWFTPLRAGGSAACTRGEYGDAILINADEAPWRRNFDLAHELFHLLTWDSPWNGEKRRLESYANHFAGGLLVPADELRALLDEKCRNNELDYADLVSIARDFGVSTEALMWRMVGLRWMPRELAEETLKDSGLRELDKASRRYRWYLPPNLPLRFVRTVFFAYTKGLMSRARLAECLDTDLVDLDEKLAEFGIENGDYHQRIACTG